MISQLLPGAGYVVVGNLDLQPENSESFQLSMELERGEWFWVSGNAFYNEIENLIGIGTISEAVSGLPARYGYINVASATTRGFETAAELELGERVSAHASYTFTDGRDNTLDRALEGRSKHRGTGRLSLEHKAWGLNGFLRAGFVGRRAYYMDTDADDVEETVYSDPYITLDARVSKSFRRIGELFIGADNLLNAGDVMFVPLPPRFFYAGFTSRFSRPNGPDSSDGIGLHRSRPSPLLPTSF